MINNKMLKLEILKIPSPNSISRYIQNYIILKLISNEWKILSLIPSENQLAIKFNCSRLTARNAINKFVSLGILKSHKGKGYIVTANVKDYLPIFIEDFQSSSTETNHLPETPKWFKKEYIKGMFVEYEKSSLVFEKEYKHNDKLQAYCIHWVNFNGLKKGKKNEENKIIKKFINHDTVFEFFNDKIIRIQGKHEYFTFINKNEFPEKIQTKIENLGWKNNELIPLIVTLFFKKDDWIMLSARLLNSKILKLNHSKLFIYF